MPGPDLGATLSDIQIRFRQNLKNFSSVNLKQITAAGGVTCSGFALITRHNHRTGAVGGKNFQQQRVRNATIQNMRRIRLILERRQTGF